MWLVEKGIKSSGTESEKSPAREITKYKKIVKFSSATAEKKP